MAERAENEVDLGYIDGWFFALVLRIHRCFHPEKDRWCQKFPWICTVDGHRWTLLVMVSLLNADLFYALFFSATGPWRGACRLQNSTVFDPQNGRMNGLHLCNVVDFCNVTLMSPTACEDSDALEFVRSTIWYRLVLTATVTWMVSSGILNVRAWYQDIYRKALGRTYHVVPRFVKSMEQDRLAYRRDLNIREIDATRSWEPRTWLVCATFEEIAIFDFDCCSTRFFQAILWVHGLARAVSDMNREHKYHLDLHPKTVEAVWYKLEEENPGFFCCRKCCPTTKTVVYLRCLQKAGRYPNNSVPSSSVGGGEFYKPPECFENYMVDAAKVDAWGVGMCAYELLTGNQMAVLRRYFPYADRIAGNVHLADLHEDFDDRRTFGCGVESNYRLLGTLLAMRVSGRPFEGLDIDQSDLMRECYDFVTGLLRHYPDQRDTVQQALDKSKLMKRIVGDLQPYHVIADF